MDNTGSFNANGSGQGGAIADAMSRLGIGQGSVMNQNPTSPNSVPPAQVPSGGQPPMPSQGAGQPSMQAMTPTDTSTGAGIPAGNPEAQVILRALNQRLSTLSEIDKASAGVQK